VSDTAPPIPEPLWTRMVDFIRAGRTGSLTVHVDQGRASVLDVRETLRVPKPGRPERYADVG
jgi:hypothetical protein